MSKIIIRNLAVLLLLSTGGYVAMAQPKTVSPQTVACACSAGPGQTCVCSASGNSCSCKTI